MEIESTRSVFSGDDDLQQLQRDRSWVDRGGLLMVVQLAQGWVVHWVMNSRWFDLFSSGYPENEGWIGGGRGQGMG
nr:hypothetical protein CFP56_77662 [Quercus suber]